MLSFRHLPPSSRLMAIRFYRTSTSKRKLLPFEEAREYVRTLNFQSTKGYREWASSGHRLPFLPANPFVSYQAEGWAGYADFLGYEKPVPAFRKPGFADKVEGNRSLVRHGNSPFAIQLRAWSLFEEFITSGCEARLDLRRLNWTSGAQYVFRPRDMAEAKWSPLLFRFRKPPANKAGSILVGRVSDLAPVAGMVFVFHDVDLAAERFFFFPKQVVAELASKYGFRKSLYISKHILLKYEVQSGIVLQSKLMEQYAKDDGTRISNDEDGHTSLLPRGGTAGGRLLHLRKQFFSAVYNNLGRNVLSRVEAGASTAAIWDVLVDSKRVIHRSVGYTSRAGHGAMLFATVGIHRYRGKFGAPLRSSDEFDFIVALDYKYFDPGHNLCGAFVFPKSAIQDALTSDERAGHFHLPLYTPRMPTKAKRSQRRKEFCLRYYIDLSDPDIIDEQIAKAKAIFDGRVTAARCVHTRMADAAVSISGEGESGVVLPDCQTQTAQARKQRE